MGLLLWTHGVFLGTQVSGKTSPRWSFCCSFSKYEYRLLVHSPTARMCSHMYSIILEKKKSKMLKRCTKNLFTLLFWCAAYSKRMPFVFGDAGNVDEDVITGSKIEVWRSLDDKVSNLGGKQQAWAYVSFPSLRFKPNDSTDSLNQVNHSGNYKPFPKIWTMKYH